MLLKKLKRWERSVSKNHLTETYTALCCVVLCVSRLSVCCYNIMCILNEPYFLHLVIGSHSLCTDLRHLCLGCLMKKKRSNRNNSIQNFLEIVKLFFFQIKAVVHKTMYERNQ